MFSSFFQKIFNTPFSYDRKDGGSYCPRQAYTQHNTLHVGAFLSQGQAVDWNDLVTVAGYGEDKPNRGGRHPVLTLVFQHTRQKQTIAIAVGQIASFPNISLATTQPGLQYKREPHRRGVTARARPLPYLALHTTLRTSPLLFIPLATA